MFMLVDTSRNIISNAYVQGSVFVISNYVYVGCIHESWILPVVRMTKKIF